jgi:small subunit ribosomal protein S7
MARRYKPEPHTVTPDPRYQSTVISTLINHVMHDGKKSVARTLVYDAFDLIEARAKQNPLDVFAEAMRNVAPVIEVRPRRVGGATYQVPMEVAPVRRQTLALRWLLDAARKRTGKSFEEKLSNELMDAAKNTGAAIRKRDEVHKMAESNRAFSHYRF